MKAFRLAGGVIHYDADLSRRGGRTLVFINSLGTDFRIWDGVRAALGGRFNVVFHDKRGHGLSSTADGPMTIANFAEDVRSLIEDLGADNLVLCGISVGGLIAQQLMLHSGLDIRGAVLSNTGLKIGDDDMWNTRLGAIEKSGLGGIAEGVIQRWLSATWREGHPELTGLYRNMLARTNQDGYVAVCRAIRDNKAFTHGDGGVPVLCIAGGQDGSTPPALVRALADGIPGSQYHEFTKAGHLPCIEEPVAFARLLAGFADGLT